VSRSQAGQQGRGIPIGDAATILGLSVDAVRKRIKRGTLHAYKQDERWYIVLPPVQLTGQPGVPPAATRLTGSPVQPTDQDEPIEAAYRVAGEAAAEVALVPLATMVEELRGLADQLAELARRNEGLALEVGTLRERQAGHKAERLAHVGEITTREQTISTQAETIAELRRRAEAAEAALARRREEEARAVELVRRRNEQERRNRERAQTAQEGPEAPEALTPDTPSGAASAGFWARVRRVFGGA